ncbi:MAG: hypothetical protein KDE19_09650, partial [Caldilineaceae bacterium]|nr:hypothetical protein [Caldilineaceae bacterium]
MNRNRSATWQAIFSMLMVLALLLTACNVPSADVPVAEEVAATPAAAEEAATEETDTAAESMAAGGLVNEVVAVEEPSAAAAVSRLETGDLDVYAFGVTDPDVYATVESSDDLTYAQSFGTYSELTFNPAGPVFEATGKLNPFAVPRVREAMNLLIDRNYVAQEIYGGLALPRYLPITGS